MSDWTVFTIVAAITCSTVFHGVSVEVFQSIPCLTSPSDTAFKLWIEVDGRMSNADRTSRIVDGVTRNMQEVVAG